MATQELAVISKTISSKKTGKASGETGASSTSTGSNEAGADTLTNLANHLPSGTFITFQALVPLFSNNGKCKATDSIMTGILVFLFISVCFLLSFADSVTTKSGKVYYGIVTPKGLFNPQFAGSKITKDLIPDDNYFTGGENNKDYCVKWGDFFNGVLNVVIFCTLTCLSPPVSTCFYPALPDNVVRTVPILVSMIVGVLLVFCPVGRHGVGFAPTGLTVVPEEGDNYTFEEYTSAGVVGDKGAAYTSKDEPPPSKPSQGKAVFTRMASSTSNAHEMAITVDSVE